MKKLKLILLISGVFLLLLSSACKKLVEIDQPTNELVTSEVFADDADATAAVLGLYVTITKQSTVTNLGNGSITLYTGLSSDELLSNTGIADEKGFYTNTISPISNGTNDQLWVQGYKLIYMANACIEGLSKSTTLTSTVKNQLLGEADFMRAFVYFYLTNLYGAVPLEITTDYHTNEVFPRTSPNAVYQQIMADLINAQKLLIPAYPTTGKLRPNQFTATALLSRVYLFQKQWANAESNATTIITSGNYGLEPNLNNVFLSGSNEAIWQMSPLQANFSTAEGFQFAQANTTSRPKYSISSYLLAAFETGDQRKTNWIQSNLFGGQTYYYPYKYKVKTGASNEYYMMFRLGEQYLIRAEARAQQGNLVGSNSAVSDLNIIRNRAGLLGYAGATDETSLLAAIVHERQVEFFCEWGNRWLDLNRLAMANAVLGTEKSPNWQAYDSLYPVPFIEIQSNPFLTQNAGY